MSYVEVLRSIVPKLELSEIPHMLTDSIAAAYYGLGRATYDLDIVKMGESERQVLDAAVVLEKRELDSICLTSKNGQMNSASARNGLRPAGLPT
jgi:hypothetical protein